MDTRLPDVLPYRNFQEQGEVDLRGAGLMLGFDLSGPSPETHGDADITSCAQQLAGAIRHLTTGDTMHVIYHRMPATMPETGPFPTKAAALVDAERRMQFENEGHWVTPTRLYLTHRYQPPVKSFIEAMLHAHTGVADLTNYELLRIQVLRRFQAFEDAASSGIGLRRLSNEEMYHDLMLIVTHHDYPALLPDDTVRLNEVIGCEHSIGGLQPYINGWHLRPVCITGYPAYTTPQLLAVLLRHPGRLLISARFICQGGYEAEQMLKAERRHWNRVAIGGIAKMFKLWWSRQASNQDADVKAQLADIDAAIAAASAGQSFGYATVTATVRDRDPQAAEQRARQLIRECHAHGIMARLEDVNAVEAIQGSWPGNVDDNIRRPIISGANFADVCLPVTRWLGL